MDTTKIIKGVVNSGRYTVTAPIVKEDYGLYLQIEGVELPSTYQVDFSNEEHHGTSVTMIGNADGVLIPHQFIDTGKDIFAFLYHVGADFGRTVYKFRIPNKCRPDRTEEQPTPEEQSTIDQCINALNSAVVQTAQDVIDAEASAQSASADADRAEQARDDAQTYANNAQTSANNASASASQASASATASAQSASQSAQIKSDVEDLVEDAQASADSSGISARASGEFASQAQGFVRQAESYALGASGYASNAQTSANTASTKASEASGYASTASQKATEASQSASQALTYKNDAESAKTASQTAQGKAEDAQTAAETAQGKAEDAQEAAESVAESIPSDYSQLSEDVSELKEDLNETHIYIDDCLDLSFVQGNINPSKGTNAGHAQRIRTNKYYPVTRNITVTFNKLTYPTTIFLSVFRYNENNEFINVQSFTTEGTFAFDIQNASYLRFLIAPAGADSTTIINPADGATMLKAFKHGVLDLIPDATLTLPNRSAEAKATGDAIGEIKNTLFKKTIYTEWQRGKISSTGTNSQSSSTIYIRNKYRYKIEKAKNHLTVPSGVTVDLFSYNSLNGSFIEQVGSYTESADITLTPNIYIRMVAYYTNLSDTPLSVGNSVILSYMDNAQDIYDNYNNYKLNDYSCLSMFETLGVIGDSWASGSIHTPNGYVDTVYAMSWAQIFGRNNGIDVTNYSRGGLNTKTWLSDSNGLSKLMADDSKQCYIINLGINDNTAIKGGTMTLGSIEDVNVSDYTLNPDTFFGNYGRIIGNIKSHAPKAIIILLSVARPDERNMDSYIEQIAEKYNLPYINLEDDEYFMSGYFFGSIYDGHMSAYGYSGMANAIQRLIQNYIIKNRLMFAYYDGLTT